MKLYVTEVIIGWFKKSYSELIIIDQWDNCVIPEAGDIMHINDKRYSVLQRDFFSPSDIKIYVKEI